MLFLVLTVYLTHAFFFEKVRRDAGFLALLSAGNHQLSFKLEGYQNKVVDLNLRPGEMARQNVILDVLHEEQMNYHTRYHS